MKIPNTIDTHSDDCEDDESLLSNDSEGCDMEAIEKAAKLFSRGNMRREAKQTAGIDLSSSSSSSPPSMKDNCNFASSGKRASQSLSCSSTSSNATLVRRNYLQRNSIGNTTSHGSACLPQHQVDQQRSSSSTSSQGSVGDTVAEQACALAPDSGNGDSGESSASSIEASVDGSAISYNSSGLKVTRKSSIGADSVVNLLQIAEDGEEVDSEEECSHTNDAALSLAGSSLNSSSVLGVGSSTGASITPSLVASSTSSSHCFGPQLPDNNNAVVYQGNMNSGNVRNMSGRGLVSATRRRSSTRRRSFTSKVEHNDVNPISAALSHNNVTSADEDDEMEIEKFTEELTRLSQNRNQHNNHEICNAGSVHSRNLSGMGINAGSYRSRTSGGSTSLLGKRRSHTDMAESAAEVAKLFGDLDSLDDSSIRNDSDDQSGLSHQSRRNTGTSVGTSALNRLSISQTMLSPFVVEENRPRKRLSAPSASQEPHLNSSGIPARSPSSSSILSSEDEMNPQHQSLFRTMLPPIKGSDSSALAAATAACAAAMATAMDRRHLYQPDDREESIKTTSNSNNHSTDSNGNVRRRMQRRVAFSVSSIETEAAQAQALRMQLLSQDRYESRKQKTLNNNNLNLVSMPGSGNNRPEARRSLSYTSGIKLASSIISSSMPEEQELYGENVATQQDLYPDDRDRRRMSRSITERRVLSLPDPTAILRLSESSNLEDTDFTSAIAAATSLTGSFVSRHSTRSNINKYDQISNLGISTNEGSIERNDIQRHRRSEEEQKQEPPESISVMIQSQNNSPSPQDIRDGFDDNQYISDPPVNDTLSDIHQNASINSTIQNIDSSMVGNQSQTFPLQNSEIPSLASTIKAEPLHVPNNFSHLTTNTSHEDVDSEMYDSDEVSSDVESFDGKNTNIFAVEPRTYNEKTASRAIHLAAKNNNSYLKSILQSCKESTRFLLDNPAVEFTGDVALHVAAKYGNIQALKYLLGADKDSALIRNASGNLAIHLAVISGHFAAVSLLCSRVPASAAVQCEEGFLPLHDAVSYGAHHQDSPQVITTLLNSFPKAILITNDEGLLPIHLASMSGFSAGLRTIFAYDFKTIFLRENTHFMLALDFAVDSFRTKLDELGSSDTKKTPRNNNNNTLADELLSVATNQTPTNRRSSDLESDPQSCIEMLLMSCFYNQPITSPHNGCTPFLPLHCAAVANPLLRTWKTLLLQYGEIYGEQLDSLGQTVLHILCNTPSSDNSEYKVKLIQDMHNFFPSLSARYDYCGFLPLHTALIQNQAPKVISAIFSCNQSAASMEVKSYSKSPYCNFLPFQIASVMDADLDLIFSLLRNHPVAVSSGLLLDQSCG